MIDETIKKLENEAIKNAKNAEVLKQHAQRLQNLYRIKKYLEENKFKDINSTNLDNGDTPLVRAIFFNNKAMWQLLIDEPLIDVNQADTYGKTPLWWAADRSNLELIKMLDKRQPDYSKAAKDKSTPLSVAIGRKFHKIAAFLIKKITGLSIHESKDYISDKSQFMIHNICANPPPMKGIQLLEILHLNHVNLDMRDDFNNTPLMVAATYGNLDEVEWLLKNGADPSLLDNENSCYLDLLPDSERKYLKERMKDANINLQWYEDVKRIKQYGHVLGIGSFLEIGNKLNLGGIIQVPIEKEGSKTAPIYTEGWFAKEAYQELTNRLAAFQNKDKDLEMIQKSIAQAVQDFDTYTDAQEPSAQSYQFFENLFLRHQNEELITIPLNTNTHGYGLAIYKDKLIYTDRFLLTGGKTHECTQIFQIKDADPVKLKAFLEKAYANPESHGEVKELLATLVGPKPLISLGDSAQTHGTCTYTNPRSNIEGILAVLHAEKLGPNNPITAENIKSSKESAHKAYREFLYSGRKEAINDLVSDLNAAHQKDDKMHSQMYYQIAESYIRGHRSASKNDGTDWQNSLELYKGMPDSYQKEFDKRNSIISRRLKISIKRQNNIESLHNVNRQAKQADTQLKSKQRQKAWLSTYSKKIKDSRNPPPTSKQVANILEQLIKIHEDHARFIEGKHTTWDLRDEMIEYNEKFKKLGKKLGANGDQTIIMLNNLVNAHKNKPFQHLTEVANKVLNNGLFEFWSYVGKIADAINEYKQSEHATLRDYAANAEILLAEKIDHFINNINHSMRPHEVNSISHSILSKDMLFEKVKPFLSDALIEKISSNLVTRQLTDFINAHEALDRAEKKPKTTLTKQETTALKDRLADLGRKLGDEQEIIKLSHLYQIHKNEPFKNAAQLAPGDTKNRIEKLWSSVATIINAIHTYKQSEHEVLREFALSAENLLGEKIEKFFNDDLKHNSLSEINYHTQVALSNNKLYGDVMPFLSDDLKERFFSTPRETPRIDREE